MNAPAPANRRGAPDTRGSFRAVQRELNAASDAKLARIVAMVDAMAERGGADRVLEALRPRLATLRPPRPLRFTRLMFHPLDALIVDPPRWQRGGATLPRSALPALAGLAHAILGPMAEHIEAIIAGHSTARADIVAVAGAMLWPAAAEALDRAGRPASWAATGLPEECFATLAASTAAVLRRAVRIETLLAGLARGQPLDRPALRALFEDAAAEGPLAWRGVSALMLLRLPDPCAVLAEMAAATRRAAPELRAMGEQALDTAIAQAAGGGDPVRLFATFPPGRIAASLSHLAGLLDGIEATSGAERRGRIGMVRAEVDEACRGWLAERLDEAILAPARMLEGKADDAQVTALEAEARALRQVEALGRRFGPGERYARLLATAAEAVAALDPAGALDAVDRARLMELLSGPDEALALLKSGPAPARPLASAAAPAMGG
jgi:hypothetical protein